MATETIERPRTSGPGSGLGGNWQVIVLNDNHNTFDHVAKTLANVVPGVNVDAGYRFADRIHNERPGDRLVGAARASRALLGAARGRRSDHGARSSSTDRSAALRRPGGEAP